jgi:hypothetical protein
LLVKIALLLLLLALLAFIAMDILAWLAIPVLPSVLSPLGLALLFSGFGLLLAGGLVLIVQRLWQSLCGYCANRQRMQRKVWFAQHQQQVIEQRFEAQTAKLRYLAEWRRQRLLHKNNTKHLRQLYKTIQQDLTRIKPQLNHQQFQQLQTELKHYKKGHDITALLKLQQHLTSLQKA